MIKGTDELKSYFHEENRFSYFFLTSFFQEENRFSKIFMRNHCLSMTVSKVICFLSPTHFIQACRRQ